MADIRATSATNAVVCNDTCGCPIPCPGGYTCRCKTSVTGVDHKKCTCGAHCTCNPCMCVRTEVKGTGRAFCTCGPGCTCLTCVDCCVIET